MEKKTESMSDISNGVLLLLNCPPKLRLGIDHQSWQIGVKFKGIKNIPNGPHYIYYSLNDEEYMAKIGFFIFIKPDTVICRKFNKEKSEFEKMPEEENEAYIEGVKNKDFELNLGPYPMERYNLWKNTTCYITESIINKLEVFFIVL